MTVCNLLKLRIFFLGILFLFLFPTLAFCDAERNLQSGEWKLKRVHIAKRRSIRIKPGLYTLKFGRKGVVAGQVICNRLTGKYLTKKDTCNTRACSSSATLTLTIKNLEITKRGCRAVESQLSGSEYYRILKETVRLRLKGKKLILFQPRSASKLVFINSRK